MNIECKESQAEKLPSSFTCRTAGKRLKVVVQYLSLPHYREPVFKLLGKDPDIDYLFVADIKSETPHLRVINTPWEKFRFTAARLVQLRLGKGVILFWQSEAVRICFQESPDAIIAHANPNSLTAWALLMLGLIMGIPVLLWGHGLLKHETGPKWWLRKAFYRLGAGHLLYGNYAKKLLVERGLPPEKLFVVYNSLDYDAQRIVAREISREDIAKFRADLGLAPEAKLVAFTGRLQRVKRLDMLLEAAARLQNRRAGLHVALVGTGDEGASLAQLARDLGIESLVHFLGESYDEHFLGTLFKASEACVIPSGAGLTIMHAMAYGTPVILHDDLGRHGPEWEAVQEGVTGFFYRAGDAEHLAEKIERVVFGAVNKQSMNEACAEVMRTRYNPHVQTRILADAVKRTVGLRLSGS